MMSSTTTRAALAAVLLSGTIVAGSAWAEAQTGSAPAGALAKVASFEHQVTGVTVTKDGRVFVNFPRWTEDSAVSVAEVKDGRITPFPMPSGMPGATRARTRFRRATIGSVSRVSWRAPTAISGFSIRPLPPWPHW